MLKTDIRKIGNREVCVNISELLEEIESAFPEETYHSIAKRANVHPISIQRWRSANKADGKAVRRFMASFDNEENIDSVLLKNASPSQLRKQCQKVGWDLILKF